MERDLIKKCQEGDTDAFGELYEHYVQNIYQFLYFKTHHKEIAEDLTSTTFIKALNGIGNFDERKASFKTWLYQIARNTVIDHYRTLHPTGDLEEIWDLKGQEDLEKQTDQKMKFEAIRDYLKTLKSEQREVILLRVWGGHSFQEIAEIMGKTEAACKMNFKRTIEKLREDFGPLLTLFLLIKTL